MAPYKGFAGPSYTSESKIAAYDRSVNWYCEKLESGTGEATYVLYPTPGYQTFCTMPTFPGRAIFTLNGGGFTIGGSALYDLSTITGGAPTLRAQGLSNPDNGVAQILSNGDAGHQLLVRSGSTLYVFDVLAPTFETTVLDPPATAPTALGFGPIAVSAMVPGWYGYGVTFVTAIGETTASPVGAGFAVNYGGGGGTSIDVSDILIGPAVGDATVTSRKLYRTTVQASQAAAQAAQLKLLTTFADNTTTGPYRDILNDSSLGANAPTTNTATVHLTALTELPYPSSEIAFLNGYGLSLDATRSEVRFSGIEDFSTWDALDVFQRNDAADKWLAMIVHHKEIWLFGSETSSVYFNDGDDPDNPFKPIPSVFIEQGIGAPLTACVVDGVPMWVGQGKDGIGVVYRANGYTPERISTHAVEDALRQIPTLTAGEGSTYQENGHVFYELTFPAAGDYPGATWEYDSTAGLWHERSDDPNVNGCVDSRDHRQLSGVQLSVSRTTGVVYHRSVAFATGPDGVTGLTRLRRAPHIHDENKGLVIDRFEVKFEPGRALATGQGSNPQFAMRFSNNGGQTWSNTRTATAGPIGNYGTRAVWRSLGYGRDRIVEVSVSDPVFWPIIDAYVSVREGAS